MHTKDRIASYVIVLFVCYCTFCIKECIAVANFTLTEKQQTWENLVSVCSTITSFIFPDDANVLWHAVWVGAMLLQDPYITYIFSTFVCVDLSVSRILMAAFNLHTSGAIEYCESAQYLTGFYATLVVHAYMSGASTVGWVVAMCLAFAFITSVIVLPCASLISAFLGLAVGGFIGLLRVAFFADVLLVPFLTMR